MKRRVAYDAKKESPRGCEWILASRVKKDLELHKEPYGDNMPDVHVTN